jgi:hypothetical protein
MDAAYHNLAVIPDSFRDDGWRGRPASPPLSALSLSKGAHSTSASTLAHPYCHRLSTGRDSHHCSFHWKLMLFQPPDGVE